VRLHSLIPNLGIEFLHSRAGAGFRWLAHRVSTGSVEEHVEDEASIWGGLRGPQR
jgi:hypothetical protein